MTYHDDRPRIIAKKPWSCQLCLGIFECSSEQHLLQHLDKVHSVKREEIDFYSHEEWRFKK